MPDFNTIYVKTCAKNVSFQREINGHTVDFNNRRGWSCDCKGYEFRKTCRHITQAQAEKCAWNFELEYWEGIEDKCPSCGGPLEVVRVAV